jgi:phage tail P2-like protein
MSFVGSDALPGNASELERSMADMDWARLSAVEVDLVRSLTDPATCPLELLPWLAWAMSVDVWDPAWSEATKRAVIAAAPQSHRLKGTRRAVRLVLEALGLSPIITEWWEDAPVRRRGTFRVTIPITGVGLELDAALFENARAAVRSAKPKSRVFTLDVVRDEAVSLSIAAAPMGRATIEIAPFEGDEI